MESKETITSIPFLPLGDSIVIAVKEKTDSGIYIAEGAEAAKTEFVSVVAISKDFKYYDSVILGDKLQLVGKLNGIVIDGVNFYIAQSHNVLGVFTQKSNKSDNSIN